MTRNEISQRIFGQIKKRLCSLLFFATRSYLGGIICFDVEGKKVKKNYFCSRGKKIHPDLDSSHDLTQKTPLNDQSRPPKRVYIT